MSQEQTPLKSEQEKSAGRGQIKIEGAKFGLYWIGGRP
jgi:hypothetical protein